MIPILNGTGHPHFFFEKIGQRNELFDILVVRGTYDFATAGGLLTRADVQDPIRVADEYAGPVEESPLAAVLAREGDLVIHKPSTDVHVIGTALAPRPATDWIASVTVGPVHKRARLLGPRRFERQGEGWRLTDPAPVAEVPLDYRRAFGGAFTVPGEALESGQPVFLTKKDNPSGCGWLPSDEELEGVPPEARPFLDAQRRAVERLDAPQIESPEEPILQPTQRAAPTGFGPLARWWSPRIERAGTYDERWREERSPGYPDDLDPRFFQSAPPELVSPAYLRGDEPIALDGMLAEGPVTMRLPGRVLVAGCERESGAITGGRMQLDTVTIDLDLRVVSLIWRGAFHRNDPAVAIELRDVAAARSGQGGSDHG